MCRISYENASRTEVHNLPIIGILKQIIWETKNCKLLV